GERASAPSSQPASTKIPSANASAPQRSTEARPAVPPSVTRHPEPNLAQAKLDSSNVTRKEAPVAAPAVPKFETHTQSPLNQSRASETQPIQVAPKPPVTGDQSGIPAKNSPGTSEPKPTTPPTNQSSELHNSAEALRLESARLQEQLSSLLWATPQAQSGSAASTKASSPEASAKVLEIPKKDLPRPAAVQNPKSGTLKMESALDAEEVRIPSWLEPLARNAAIPVRTEAPAKSEPAPEQKAEKFELQEVASVARAQEIEATKLQEPIFDEALADETTAETGSTIAKNKGILFGAIAAGVLILIAGGSWLLRRPANPVQSSSPAAATQAPAAAG